MSTARNALYAAVGAGGLAVERARNLPRSLPRRVAALPGEVRSRAGELKKLRDVRPPSLKSLDAKKVRKAFDDSVKQARKQATTGRKRLSKTYGQLAKRGEKLVKRISRSAPAKRAIEQTKNARSRVKAAATSIRKAAQADAEAAKAAVETVVEQTG